MTTSRLPPGPEPSARLRSEALKRYAIAGPQAEPAFYRLCQAAARMLRAPAAAVVFSDDDRDWVMACCGFPPPPQSADGQPRSALFRAALAHDGVLVVEDCAADARFRDDGWVSAAPDVRFFAGAPIRTPDGISVGVLAVFDAVRRTSAALDCDALSTLAAVVMDEAELRVTGGQPSPPAPLPLDVAERRRAESQLAQAERLASLGTLAAGVAHEINNPLTYVLANVGFVADRLGRMGRSLPAGVTLEWADELGELGAALAEAQEGALRVRRIVRDLRVFSDHDDEKVGPTDLHRSLESAITVAIHEIGPRARLIRRLGPVPAVEASESRLAQLFVNLLVNAAQAIDPGGFEANEIRVITETDGQGRAVVRVQDTGQGIAGETIGRIFDPFFTTKPLGGGLGLGLFVAHGIVKALGGEIAVDSVPGQGTTFRVTLPPAERARVDPSAEASRGSEPPRECTPTPTPTPTGPGIPRSPSLPPK